MTTEEYRRVATKGMSEADHQRAVIQWRDAMCRDAGYEHAGELALLHHTPNGGARSAATGARMKALGTLAGMPDLCLPCPRPTRDEDVQGPGEISFSGALYIELKTDAGRLRESQERVIRALQQAGNVCVVCYGANDAIATIKAYLDGKL